MLIGRNVNDCTMLTRGIDQIRFRQPGPDPRNQAQPDFTDKRYSNRAAPNVTEPNQQVNRHQRGRTAVVQLRFDRTAIQHCAANHRSAD
ncbi:hypothetical protein GCM10027563_24820 [Parasphingorhabdus pacifica]